MTDLKLKDRLAYILFIAKFVLMGWVFAMHITGGYSFQQMLEILGIIIPVFSVYLTLIIKDYFETQDKRRRGRTIKKKPIIVFSQLLPIAYTLYMLMVISTLKAEEVAFQQMKTLLGLGETIFGVYIGIIISYFFKIGKNNNER